MLPTEIEKPLFWEAVRLLHRMKLNKLIEEVTYQKLNAELYGDQDCLESEFEQRFLKYLFILCANVPYFEMTLPIGWYEVYVQDHIEKVEEVEIRALYIYEKYRTRYNKSQPDYVFDRRLEREERKKKEAKMNERLRPRIMYDIMRQSENAIIFPEKNIL